jgi:hypothetical protein
VLLLPRTDPAGSGLPLNDQSHSQRRERSCARASGSWPVKADKPTDRLKEVRRLGIDRDSDRGNIPDDVRERVELGVVLVNGKASRVGVAVGGKGDVFADVGDTLEGTVRVKAKGKVIQRISVAASSRPDSQTEAADNRRTRRVKDFRVVRMPLGKTLVDNGAIGNGRIRSALGCEDDVPETDD